MKTSAFFGILLAAIMLAATSIQATAQEVATGPSSFNEIKVNALYMVLGIAEFSYERVLNDEAAVGISIAASFDDDVEWLGGVSPYYRWYFYGKKASGLFMEGNAAVYSVETSFYEYDPLIGSVYKEEQSVGAGLGFALGYKLMSDNGWVGEVYAGVGRNMIETDHGYEAYPRLGVSLGRRFGK